MPDLIASFWATRLAGQLKYEGFDNVSVLDGGFLKWKEEGRPITTVPIPGSVNLFFGALYDPETREIYYDEKLREILNKVGALDPNKKVTTYCGSAIAATWTGTLLNKLGQNNVAVYDGSMTEWAAKDSTLPLEIE